jgi:hypothetical protein
LVLTELDVSANYDSHYANSRDGPGFAHELAVGIKDNGALSKLIFGGDRYHNGEKWVTAEPATFEFGMAEIDFSNKHLQAAGAIIVAAWISHKDKGALTSLDLSSNALKVEGAKIVAEAIKVRNYAIAVVLAPVSCPSDHWLNCCCVLLSTGYEGDDKPEFGQ